MKVIARQNRDLVLINAQNTQNENDAEKITLQVPEQYEDFNKKIVFVTPDGNVWDIITNNEYLIKKAITKYKQVDFYIWLTKGDVDFRSQTKTLKFYQNVDASDEITDKEIGRVNTVVNLLEEEITKVENLESQIDGKLEEVDTAIDNIHTAIQETENLDLDAEKVGQTTTITLTKKDGTVKTVHVDDGIQGEKGAKGDKGDKGNDGVSPTISVNKDGKVTTLQITDVNGTHTATINDGLDGTGSGDMLKSDYDSDNNGIVDDAEKVNGHIVESDVPANAKFTDTIYDDTSIKADIQTNETNIEIIGNYLNGHTINSDVPANAKFTDTIYNDTTIKNDINTLKTGKQDKLTAGTGIEITGENIINNIQGNYSTEEQVIGKWDNKPLYRKYFSIPALPNNTYKDYYVSINNLEYIKNLRGMAYTDTTFIPIPDVSASSFIRLVALGKSTSSIGLRIQTTADRSDMRGIITLEYTKTTD